MMTLLFKAGVPLKYAIPVGLTLDALLVYLFLNSLVNIWRSL